MSADKYPSIFSRQIEAIVYIMHPLDCVGVLSITKLLKRVL